MKERHIGQVSFNLLNDYEKGLFIHASKKEHGGFSQYIKRLIERDREGYNVIPLKPVPLNNIDVEKENIIAAESFL